jgi:putative nucleotidyltransferase with HDIG domain
MGQCRMLGNIVEHSLVVARVARYLAEALREKGQEIDAGLVEAASLLHDITKTECLVTKEDHAETGFRFLLSMGYERVGEVVAYHVRLPPGGESARVTETEIVNYADKRVRHNRIVSLEERFVDLRARYGTEQKAVEYLEAMKEKTLEVERKIFSILRIDPGIIETLEEEN